MVYQPMIKGIYVPPVFFHRRLTALHPAQFLLEPLYICCLYGVDHPTCLLRFRPESLPDPKSGPVHLIFCLLLCQSRPPGRNPADSLRHNFPVTFPPVFPLWCEKQPGTQIAQSAIPACLGWAGICPSALV